MTPALFEFPSQQCDDPPSPESCLKCIETLDADGDHALLCSRNFHDIHDKIKYVVSQMAEKASAASEGVVPSVKCEKKHLLGGRLLVIYWLLRGQPHAVDVRAVNGSIPSKIPGTP